jgi:hypothetical protein
MRSPLACRRSGRRREKWTAPGRACRQSIQPLHREVGARRPSISPAGPSRL